METATATTMTAKVLRRINPCCLLVCDCSPCREVLVHTNQACRFAPGDLVCIHYSGAMTMSIPPQITAQHICCASGD